MSYSMRPFPLMMSGVLSVVVLAGCTTSKPPEQSKAKVSAKVTADKQSKMTPQSPKASSKQLIYPIVERFPSGTMTMPKDFKEKAWYGNTHKLSESWSVTAYHRLTPFKCSNMMDKCKPIEPYAILKWVQKDRRPQYQAITGFTAGHESHEITFDPIKIAVPHVFSLTTTSTRGEDHRTINGTAHVYRIDPKTQKLISLWSGKTFATTYVSGSTDEDDFYCGYGVSAKFSYDKTSRMMTLERTPYGTNGTAKHFLESCPKPKLKLTKVQFSIDGMKSK